MATTTTLPSGVEGSYQAFHLYHHTDAALVAFMAILAVGYTMGAALIWSRQDFFDGSTGLRARGVWLFGLGFCLACAALAVAALIAWAVG